MQCDRTEPDAGFEKKIAPRVRGFVAVAAWVGIHDCVVLGKGDMGSHIMKTTIEIADDLFKAAQELARKEKTTFRALTESGLRRVLADKKRRKGKKELPPLFSVRGKGLSDEFKNATWEDIRDAIYSIPPL